MSGQANPVAQEVFARMTPLGPCSIVGRLYAVGPTFRHPGLLEEPGGLVQGELLRIDTGSEGAVLREFDAYEGFVAADPAGSAYVRRLVHLQAPALSAFVYVYNPKVTRVALLPITSGSWTTFQAERQTRR